MTKETLVGKSAPVCVCVCVSQASMCDFYYYDHNTALTPERTMARFLQRNKRPNKKVDKKRQTVSEKQGEC